MIANVVLLFVVLIQLLGLYVLSTPSRHAKAQARVKTWADEARLRGWELSDWLKSTLAQVKVKVEQVKAKLNTGHAYQP